MASQRAPALILDVFDLGERDRLVVFLTAERGKLRAAARGARTKYSRFAGRLQPLAKVDLSWFEKEGRELVRLQEVELVRSPAALHGTLEDILLAAYLADHMNAFAQENEPAPALFRLLDTTVEALLDGIDRQLAGRYFEVWMLRLAGIFPPPHACPRCGRPFSRGAVLIEDDSVLACTDCAGAAGGGFVVGGAEVEFLLRSARENLPAMAARTPPAAILARIEALCGRIRRAFLQHELRSYRVMKKTLQPPATAGAGGR
ncbi:MAG: DNA repair protein RecO [Acidobacteria bacterium]|nr:MAG: DNA repair protein RecO [Acidobacteriota bacterium]